MSDFNIDEYKILKYIQGQCSPAEREEILQWLTTSEKNRKVYFRLKALWYALRAGINAKSENLEQKLAACRKKARPSGQPGISVSFAKYAAISIMVLGIPSLIWYSYIYRPKLITLQVGAREEVKSIVLSDSTKVWLNKNSKITYPQPFSGKDRLIKLEGEAYFEVEKDSQHPFKVQTPAITVCVMGTSFNVKTQNKLQLTETTLTEGTVALQEKGGKDIAVMKPGEQARFDARTNKLTVKQVDVNTYTAWHQGITLLKNVTVAEIAKVIEKMFHIEVRVNITGLESDKYDFTILKGQAVDTVMEMLRFIAPIKYTVTNAQINISKK
ncbi:MAG: FecR domain-containing protein [Bacteroidota bacterium]|nr:FecR domain-containing protein [Bacteroidota bacterium]